MRSTRVPEEGSPLLGEAQARYWSDAGEQQGPGSTRDRSRKRWRRAATPLDVSYDRSVFRRHWRVSAGVAGVLLLSMALAGLGAIFSTVQRERAAPRSSGTALDGLDDAAAASSRTPATTVSPEDARQSRHRGERPHKKAWKKYVTPC